MSTVNHQLIQLKILKYFLKFVEIFFQACSNIFFPFTKQINFVAINPVIDTWTILITKLPNLC